MHFRVKFILVNHTYVGLSNMLFQRMEDSMYMLIPNKAYINAAKQQSSHMF